MGILDFYSECNEFPPILLTGVVPEKAEQGAGTPSSRRGSEWPMWSQWRACGEALLTLPVRQTRGGQVGTRTILLLPASCSLLLGIMEALWGNCASASSCPLWGEITISMVGAALEEADKLKVKIRFVTEFKPVKTLDSFTYAANVSWVSTMCQALCSTEDRTKNQADIEITKRRRRSQRTH